MRPVVCAVLVTAIACSEPPAASAPPPPSVSLPTAFDRVLRDYERAYAGRDAGALAALFADDGFLLQPGRPPVHGRADVARILASEGGPLSLVPISYAVADSVGYIIGTFGAERSAGAGGKFVLALKRRGAEPWRIAADIANPNR